LQRDLREDSVRPLKHDLVDVAPAPVFAGLEGLNNWVVGRVEMLCRMLVFRRVAAADVPTNKALAQMYPGVASFQAVLAAVCAGCDLSYLIKMGALLCHLFLSSFFCSFRRLGALGEEEPVYTSRYYQLLNSL
jgi:hypothetical protein